jgi:hypothetical protein
MHLVQVEHNNNNNRSVGLLAGFSLICVRHGTEFANVWINWLWILYCGVITWIVGKQRLLKHVSATTDTQQRHCWTRYLPCSPCRGCIARTYEKDIVDQQTRICLTVMKIWSWAPGGGLTPKQTGRLTVGRNMTLSCGWPLEIFQGAHWSAITSRSHTKSWEWRMNHENVSSTGQGEIRYRKYKSPKLGGGHACDRSSD